MPVATELVHCAAGACMGLRVRVGRSDRDRPGRGPWPGRVPGRAGGSSRRRRQPQAGPGAAGLHHHRLNQLPRSDTAAQSPGPANASPRPPVPTECPVALPTQWHEAASGANAHRERPWKMARLGTLGLSSPRKLQTRAAALRVQFRSDGTGACLHAAAASTFRVRRSSDFKLEA